MKSLQELCQRRSESVQPKGFCNTLTRVTKGPLRISLPPRVQEAMAGSHHTGAPGPVSRRKKRGTVVHSASPEAWAWRSCRKHDKTIFCLRQVQQILKNV